MVASVPQTKVPTPFAFTSQLAAFKVETMRFVDEAVVAVMAVVEAYEMVEGAAPVKERVEVEVRVFPKKAVPAK